MAMRKKKNNKKKAEHRSQPRYRMLPIYTEPEPEVICTGEDVEKKLYDLIKEMSHFDNVSWFIDHCIEQLEELRDPISNC